MSATGSLEVTVDGHCSMGIDGVRTALGAGAVDTILESSGDFVVTVAEPTRETAVCSRSGMVAHFIGRDHGRCAHGSTVADVVTALGLPWEWDHDAVADYLVVGHPLENRTIHPAVTRLPAGSITTVERDGSRLTVFPVNPTTCDPHPSAGLEDAKSSLLEAVAGQVPDQCALSLSGGLDSRLLLSALLHLGIRPTLYVSGPPGCFDRDVAQSVARHFDLELTSTCVTAAQVAHGATEVSVVTNGLLPATAMAGREHLRQVSPTAGPVLLGAGGEYARNYYASRVGLTAARQCRRPRSEMAAILGRHVAPVFTPSELNLVSPSLRRSLEPAAVWSRVQQSLHDAPGRTAGDVADEFFLTQYARHRDGADLAAIGTSNEWRVPLFDPQWVDVVRRLPRYWKIGDRLHRRLIAELDPRLLEFPGQRDRGPRLARRPPRRTWVRGTPSDATPHYLDQTMFRTGPLMELFREHREQLADLVSPRLVDALANEQRTSNRRPQVAFAVLALAAHRAAVSS